MSGSSGVVEEEVHRSQAWFCTTGLPADLVVDLHNMTFHLHKFPLMSKSRKIHHMIDQNPKTKLKSDDDDDADDDGDGDGVGEEEVHHISLPNFPGGAATFEAAAKFCYGGKLEITAWTAVSLRCAAEYLDMSDDFSQDNLISRTDNFLGQSVFADLRQSVQALNSCHHLLPMAEDLGIVQRCVESIAAYACSADPVNDWPVNNGGSVLWNGIDTGARRRVRSFSSSSTAAAASAGSWVDDLALLTLPFYKRVVAAIRAADPASEEALEGSLVSYAQISIPGLSRSTRKPNCAASAPLASETEQRELLDTVIANLPAEKPSAGATTTRFLFRLLRTVNILRASEASRAALERRIASQLEQATVDDLLIPSYSDQVDSTLYDVECMDRILAYFIRAPTTTDTDIERVGKLIDGYLAEIGSDPNLRPQMFCDLVLALPDHARVYDDGLYRAVDVYLKGHPGITEEEKERVSGVMDCQKLTLEACTHAAQNECLPLRAVVQVLFFEQLQLRHAIAGTTQPPPPDTHTHPASGRRRENQVLHLDMDSMRRRVQELENECSTMRNKMEKMDGHRSWASSFAKKLGCRFKTQVCHSHDRTLTIKSKKR